MRRLVHCLAHSLSACAGLAAVQTEPILIPTTYPATGSSSTATTMPACGEVVEPTT